MDYFFISGAPDTGKNALIHEIAWILINNGYADITTGFPIPRVDTSREFTCILEGLNNQRVRRRILINTATDDMACINVLMQFYREHLPVDIVITSIRDGVDPMRAALLNQLQINRELDFQLELPLGKITRRNQFGESLTWYQNTLLNMAMHILRRNPFDL